MCDNVLRRLLTTVFFSNYFKKIKLKNENMKLLKWLFGKEKTEFNKDVVISNVDAEFKNKDDVTSSIKDEIKSKYDGFDIEELPYAGRYFPRYKGQYMYFWNTRQNYELQSDISGTVYADTKEGAKRHIDKYLELRGVSTNILSVE